MSIYIVKHFNKHYYFHLKDEYHHIFLNFWKDNNTSEKVEITDTLKKGILNSNITEYIDMMHYYLFRNYCSKIGVRNYPLWWYLDTCNMKHILIPQN